jgi:hypothetical protein
VYFGVILKSIVKCHGKVLCWIMSGAGGCVQEVEWSARTDKGWKPVNSKFVFYFGKKRLYFTT